MIIPGLIIFSLLPPPLPPATTYYSECIFSISDIAQIEKVENIIRNMRLISSKDILPVIYPELWNAKENVWKTVKPPTMQSVREQIRELTTVKVDKVNGIVELRFNHNSIDLPQKMLQIIISELENYFSEVVKEKISDNRYIVKMLRKELVSTNDPDLKKSIAAYLASHINNEKELLVNMAKSPISMISPPTAVYLETNTKGSKSGLGTSARIFLSFLPMLILGIFFSGCMEFIESLKKSESNRLRIFKEYLKILHK
jgi:hypothetical protein